MDEVHEVRDAKSAAVLLAVMVVSAEVLAEQASD